MKYGFLLLSLITLACYKPAEILFTEGSETKYVIEGVVTDGNERPWISVSLISDPNSSAVFLPVDSAEVYLSDNLGNSEQLNQIIPGIYTANAIKGKVGMVYNLNVFIGDKHFSASDKMHPISIMDSSYCKWVENSDYFENGYYISSKVKWLNDTLEYYRLKFYRNDSLYNSYLDFLLFETTEDIDETESLIPFLLEKNDTVKLRLYSLSKEMFSYWYAYAKITSSTFYNSSIPAQNPPSNILGGALGYFQVSSLKKHVIIIK